ncbi:MAG: glycosyltransferase family 4 protein, partial [Nitrospiria bacterium]
ALEILTREKGLGDFVSFTGVQPHETIPALLREADCLVLPSLSEGMPNVVLEAMASGLPVVASNLPGIREVVQDGETGLLAEPGDARGLAKKLMTMIHEPEQRREMGRRGYRYITAMNLSWEQSARHYLEVYRKACAASRVSST